MAVSDVDMFPKTELSLDLDPCSECLHCGFLSHSREHLENHTTNNHNGIEIKTQKKIISLAVSAKVRQADALFYSVNANKTSKKSSSIQGLSDGPGDMKPPSMSNTGVLESCEDFKDMSLDVNLNQMAFRPNTFGPTEQGTIEYAKYLSRELMSFFRSDTKKEMNVVSKWTPKVETLYCLSCPFNNVHLENLKCHVFTLHAGTVAVARNSLSGNNVTPDPTAIWTFFCVKETCSHYSEHFTTYEKHLMACCPSSQKFSEEVTQRLNSTLSFLLYFHKNSIIRATPKFNKYASLFGKNFAESGPNSRKTKKLIGEMIQRHIDAPCQSVNANKEPDSVARQALRRSQRKSHNVCYTDDDDEMDSDDEYHATSDEEISGGSESD